MVLAGCSPSTGIPEGFKEHDIDLATYNLHDLGVVDVNADHMLDIFTVNHSARQSLAINQGAAHFVEGFSEWKLDQDAAFPGLALTPEEPAVAHPGLYIHWRDTELVVRSFQLTDPSASPVSGTIELLTPVKLGASDGYTVKLNAEPLPLGATRSIIHFSAVSDGYFSFVPEQDAVPIRFHLDGQFDPGKIFVGHHLVSPLSSDFTFHMRDRHAMAWADYNGDRRMDVFIGRGALSGTLKITPLTLWDALYVQRDGGMADVAESVLPDKHGCPARQAQWVDFDRDGRLDLLMICGRGGFSSRLLRQGGNGMFTDVADEAGLALATEGKFVWLDSDADGDPDLIWVDSRGIYLYRNQGGHFQAQQLAGFSLDPAVTGLRVGDMDADGDADVFIESPISSRLLVSAGGTYNVIDAASVGLPHQSKSANWVDVDNDGTLELHSVPDGIFRRTAEGTYIATGELRWSCGTLCPYKLLDALASWADMNNDGTRDLVIAANLTTKRERWASWLSWLRGDSPERINPFGGRWVVKMFINSNHQNHWLDIDIAGPSGNRQGLGARVILHAGDGTQTRYIGDAEGARYSQGHYRLYFGLGKHDKADSVTIDWTDGTVQTVVNPKIDSLVTVKYDRRGTP